MSSGVVVGKEYIISVEQNCLFDFLEWLKEQTTLAPQIIDKFERNEKTYWDVRFLVDSDDAKKKETVQSGELCSTHSKNKCEGCPIYEEMKQGKTIVSDACSFCSKNPFKITCEAK